MEAIQPGALIGCGGLISTAQALILPEDIGLIVELWTDELSSPTLLPPPHSQGRGSESSTPPPDLGLKSPTIPEPGDRRRLRQAFGSTDAGEDVFTWPGKVYDRGEGWENEASVRTDGRRGEVGRYGCKK